MKTPLSKIFSGILIAAYLFSMGLPTAVSATPQQVSQNQSPSAKHEPKRGTNPETGKLSFIGSGDPIFVSGVSDVKGMSPQQRAMGLVSAYGKEFGLKNPSQELKLLKLEKDGNGKDVARYQQMYKGVPVIAGEMIVNMNAEGELLSINGEVSSDLSLDTKPAIKAQDARKVGLSEMAKLHQVDVKELTSTDPELWIFDESLLTASTRLVELVWRMEVTAKDATQPIRELVLVNAQTGEISFHINQVDAQGLVWPVYLDIELDETRGWIYGSDSNGNKIDVISMSTLELVKSFTLVNGANPKGIALSPDGSELAVAQYGASSILFLNPDTGAIIATVIPNTAYTKAPWDVTYGRTGRLYSSGASDYYIHVIDTATHLEVSRSPLNFSLTATRLAISSDKNWLYASRSSGSPMKLYKYDVSTDTFPEPTSTAHTSNFSASTFILDTVDNLIFTDTGQVWTPDLKGNIGSTGSSGQVAYIPSHNAIAIASSITNTVVFASAQNFYPLSTYSLQGPMGSIVAKADGNKVFVSTSNGIASIDLANFPPGTPVALPAGSLPYSDVIIDESHGVLYGSNTTGQKIDVVSISTLQIVDQIRFNNGANPQGMDLSPDGEELAVALKGASSLVFIDTNTRTISATVIPNLDGAIMPFDVKYGRAGRLYSSGTGGLDYLHVFDTTTHTEVGISPHPNTISYAPYLAISTDKNSVYANESSQVVRLFNVSTDSPVISTNTSSTYRGINFLLQADNSKLFTSAGQVWLSSLNAQIGSFNASGNLVEIPGQNLVAVISSASPGLITFVKAADFYTASTASIPSVSAVGASAASSAGDKLYVNTNSGIKVLDITPSNPSSISLVSGSPQTVQVTTQFQQPFKVKVQNVVGDPMVGVLVTFTAPSTAASGTFADTNSNMTSAVTDGNGIATSSIFTANNVAGTYIVKATIPNLASSADFQLTNIAAVTCTITNGSGSPTLFLPYKLYNCGTTSHGVGVGDFNNDGKKDVALSAGSLLVFLQDNNGNLSQPRVYVGGSADLTVGDVNGDELDDIVTSNGNSIDVFLQRNDGTLAYRVTYPASTLVDAVAVGDVNSDGLKDVAVSHWNSAVIGVFTQNLDGTLNPMVTYPSITAGYDDIAIGDVNGDGRNDVVKMNGAYRDSNIMVYLQNSANTLNPSVNYSIAACATPCRSTGIAIGDVTGDGRSDVILSYGGNKPDSNIAVFPQDVDGSFKPSISYPAYDIPVPVEVADLDSDDLLDVAILHSAWGRAGTFLQQQDGNLGSESLYLLPYDNSSYEPQDLSIGDVNNDSLPDLLIANYRGLVVLYRNTTIPPTSTPVPTYTPSSTPGPTFTPSPTFTPGPGPSPTPRPSSTPGPSPTPVPPGSTGSRRTYSASGAYTYPGTFLCDETQPICTNGADLDADNAHLFAADTFVFYNTHHARNSFDNQGGTIISTVNYGVGYQNAFWTGSQMVYGDAMAADDVVGHELTHGVTQYTSGLIYSYQSGAINESFSDVWGEFIDQTNSSGNDSPSVKWLMGEDTPLGAIRSMSNPPAYGDPDKMSSPYYYNGSGDNGGVHTNSGVNNKAAYLMVDGATFNGRNITGIGLNKTAAVYYEAQTNLLTAGSNYNDLYYALIQACQNLIGGVDGITQNDCDQVRLAAEAVEMIPAPIPTPTPTATNTATFTPTNTFTPTVTPPYSYNPLYLSLTSSQTIGGVSSADEDILRFDGQNWSLYFDGSDVGVGSPDLFAFSFIDSDSILMSFTANVTVNGITATPQDVLRFDATSLGSTTAGTFSLYFDGSDVGFDTTSENIDSLSLLPDGRLLVSTTGNPSVPGLTTGKDEDVLAFTPTSLGDVTSGTWSMYFDGSDVGLADSSNEDVDALDVTSNGNIYLSTLGDFAVNGVSGFDEDVFVCVPTSIGEVTACNYSPNLYFDGSTWGLSANDVDAFNFLSLVPVPTSTPTSTPSNTPTATNTPTWTPSPTATKTFTPTVTSVATNTPVTPLTLTVNSLLDAVDVNPGNGVCETETGNGICTLRAAIQESNARSSADTIMLQAGTYTLTLPGVFEEASASGDLNITGDLTITGAGSKGTIIDGNGSVLNDRVIYIMGAYRVNISDLTIRGGNPNPNNGGGIYNQGGTLTLSRVALRDNIGGSGGALLNRGTAALIESSVYNNSAPYGAAGIQNDKVLTIIKSTISGNVSNNDGGGIFNRGNLTISNSTISANQAYSYGGGIFNGYSDVGSPDATIDLKNVTITNNVAEANNDGYGDGGGIYMVDTGTVNLQNTILAGNISSAGAPDCDGTLTSNGNNLIKSTSGCTVTGNTTGNLIGVNPNLGPLQDNGGQTTTHALQSNSPAVDAGNDATCESTDQRGYSRPQGAHCDMGAFEYLVPVVPTNTPTSTATAGTPTTLTFAAAADTRVSQASPTTNYGTATTILVDGDSGAAQNGFIRFTASGINGSIQSAKLKVYCTTNGTANGPASYLADNTWTESGSGGMTWNTQPALLSSAFDNKGAIGTDSWVEYDVTALVTGNGTYTFALVADSSDGITFSSREGTTPPQLVVALGPTSSTPTYTPSPSATFTGTPTATSVASPTNTGTATATTIASITPTSTSTFTPTATSTLTLTFTPIADAYIASGSPTTNYGSATTLQVDNSPIKHFLIKFDVSGLNGQQVASAKLRFYNVDPSSKGGDFYAVSDNSWQEETITWNNAPAALPTLLASLGSVSVNNWYEVDITSLITSDGMYSLRISSTSSDGADYSSKEGTNLPQLIITLH